jgi:DNA-directed RNA polymerase beta subunit
LVDSSLIHDKPEKFIIDDIIYRDDVNVPFIMIRMKSYRPVEQGDKFSSRSGCKGTAGEVKFSWDMPYTRDGI